MVQNKTFSAKALQTFVAVMFAVITCFGFMTTPTAEAASGSMGFRLDLQAFAPACSYYCLIIGVLYQSIYFVTRCRAVLFYAAAVLWVKSQYWLTFHGQSDILNIVNKGVNALKGMIL